MVSPEQVKVTIEAALTDAQVHIRDLTGGGDHYEAIVISSDFEDKSLIKQHQLVYRALKAEMESEAIHALALKTYTPESWKMAEEAR
jgi:acid stress-induced BolA-like protein IbaG/YrbA